MCVCVYLELPYKFTETSFAGGSAAPFVVNSITNINIVRSCKKPAKLRMAITLLGESERRFAMSFVGSHGGAYESC